MKITDRMVKLIKTYAEENEERYLHLASDGDVPENYPGFWFRDEYVMNPWSIYGPMTTEDPFKTYGAENMELFCVEILAGKDVEQLRNDDCPSGWLYIGEEGEGRERFALGEVGTHTMLCFGINPSKAMPKEDDPTIKRVRKYAAKYGCDGWMMLNLYPIRHTSPDALPKEPDKLAMRKNEWIVKGLLNRYKDAPLWAAWGTNIEKQNYLSELLWKNPELFCDRKWLRRGKCSKAGHPHHPLYVAEQEEFKEFDMDAYCRSLLMKRQHTFR